MQPLNSTLHLSLAHLAGIRRTSVCLPIFHDYNASSDDTRNATHTTHRWSDGTLNSHSYWMDALIDGVVPKTFKWSPGHISFRFVLRRQARKKKKRKMRNGRTIFRSCVWCHFPNRHLHQHQHQQRKLSLPSIRFARRSLYRRTYCTTYDYNDSHKKHRDAWHTHFLCLTSCGWNCLLGDELCVTMTALHCQWWCVCALEHFGSSAPHSAPKQQRRRRHGVSCEWMR